jgi:hypothetical protein
VAAAEGTGDHKGDGLWLAAATDADGIAWGVGPKAKAVVTVRARMKVVALAVRANLANIEIQLSVLYFGKCIAPRQLCALKNSGSALDASDRTLTAGEGTSSYE